MSLKFDYVEDHLTKQLLETAYDAITTLELWEYMKKDIVSYMLSSDIELNQIMNQIIAIGYHGHSGFSFGWIMREMQYIAQYGLLSHEESWQNKNV